MWSEGLDGSSHTDHPPEDHTRRCFAHQRVSLGGHHPRGAGGRRLVEGAASTDATDTTDALDALDALDARLSAARRPRHITAKVGDLWLGRSLSVRPLTLDG